MSPGVIPGLLAHGGVAGAIAESFVLIAVVGVFVAVWLREKSASSHDDDEELTE